MRCDVSAILLARDGSARGVRLESGEEILAALEAPIGPGLAVDTMEIYWRRPKSTELHLLFGMADGLLAAGFCGILGALSQLRTKEWAAGLVGVAFLASHRVLYALIVE